MFSNYEKILDFVVSAGRVTDKDSAQAEAEFEAMERGMTTEQIIEAGKYAYVHYRG